MKIDLEQNKLDAIQKLMAVGGAGVEALRELFSRAEAELSDVRNIDPKGNMGLQSLAAQQAIKVLDEIKSQIFPDETPVSRKESNKAPVGQFR